MSNGMTVDPDLINQAYQSMLAESNHQVALLKGAATQLQNQLAQVTAERDELKKSNEQLLAASGRQDGAPQPEPEPTAEQ